MQGRAWCLLAWWPGLLLGGTASATPAPTSAHSAQTLSCGELLGALEANPGLWAPAYALQVLRVIPESWNAPAIGQETKEVELVGLCDAETFPASGFASTMPSSIGGDWIVAANATKLLQFVVDGKSCPLSHIALSSEGWPKLRLQFDGCAPKRAVVVDLVQATGNARGMRLVSWMCRVPGSSQLCTDAAQGTAQVLSDGIHSESTYLDLSALAEAASQGLTRLRIQPEDCFDFGTIDWFKLDTALSLDAEEWDLLQSIRGKLAPSTMPAYDFQATGVVDRACMKNCQRQMAHDCYAKLGGVVEAAPACDTTCLIADIIHHPHMDYFRDKDVLPYLLALLLLFILLGLCVGLCCVRAFCKAPGTRRRGIKEVKLLYQDSHEAMATVQGR